MRRTIKKIAITIGIAGIGLIAFLSYSVISVFDNWPWTQRELISSGSYLGFSIHSDTRQAFDNVIELQSSGAIQALGLLGEEPTTYNRSYKGTPVLVDDFSRVAASDQWHLGLVECNCWLILRFSEGQLIEVNRYDYYGPTE